MRLVSAGLLLCAAAFADPASDAADKVLAAIRAKQDLKPLAAKDKPDPWLVADELCRRKEFDAAEAFAKAAPRPDVAKLPAYVAVRRVKPTPAGLRKLLDEQRAAWAAKDWPRVVELTRKAGDSRDTLTAIRLKNGYASALYHLTDGAGDAVLAAWREVLEGYKGLGRVSAEGRIQSLLGVLHRRRREYDEALTCFGVAIADAKRRGDLGLESEATGNIGVVYGDLGRARDAVAQHEKAIALRAKAGFPPAALRHRNAAGQYYRLSEQKKALEHYRAALAIHQRNKDLAEAALVRFEISRALIAMGEVRAARRIIEDLLPDARRYGLPMDQVQFALALCARQLAEWDRARRHYEAMAAAAKQRGDLFQECAALVSLAELDVRAGADAVAKQRLEEARRKGSALQATERAGLLNLAGEAWLELDETRGLRLLDEAAALYGRVGNLTLQGGTIGKILKVHLRRCDWRRAQECTAEQRRLARAAGDRKLLAGALGAEVSIAQRQGNYAEALRLQEKAAEIYKALDDPRLMAVAFTNLGSVYGAVRDYPRAIDYTHRALELHERLGNPLAGVTAQSNLAAFFDESGSDADAETAYARAIELGERHPDRRWLAHALMNYSGFLRSRGKPKEALPMIRRALEQVDERATPDIAAKVQSVLGNILGRIGRVAEALPHLERALALARRYGLTETRLHALRDLAGSDLAAGRHVDALRRAREAVAGLAHVAGRLEEGAAARSREQWHSLFDVGVLAGFYAGKPEEVCFFLESGRGITLLESLRARDMLQAYALPPELDRAERDARFRLQRVRLRYEQAAIADKGAEEAWEALQKAQSKVLEIAQRIQREAKHAAALVYPKPDNVAQIRSALGPGETLVLYKVLPEQVVAVVVNRTEIYPVMLGDPEKMRATVRKLQAALQRPDERGMRIPLHERLPAVRKRLRAMLVDPLKPRKKTTRLLVSPDGMLAYVPFAALTDLEVAYVPSGTTHRLLRETATGRGAGVLAVGDAQSDAGALPESGKEAQAVGDTVLLGKGATVARLRATLGGDKRWRAVHFACHGLIDPERPALSQLALTGEPLRCLDIYRMKIPADLVVLSACETGKGRIYKAEGVIGWTRAFLFAGAPRVIVSLWKVDDAATRALMEKFYALWKNGKMPAATALKKAQVFVRSQERWKHPYFWAAWQLWGLGE